MEPGEEWVYRPKARTAGAPIFRVKIEKVRPGKSPKIQLRVLEGADTGLLLWASKITLKVPWDECDAWRVDEERYELATADSWSWFDTPEYNAAHRLVDEIWSGSAIQLGWNVPVRALLLVTDLPSAKLEFGQDLEELLADPLTFTDRFGTLVAPKAAALRWAQRACTVLADDVVRWVEREDEQLRNSLIHGETLPMGRGEPPFWISPERCAERFDEQNAVLEVLCSWCGAGPKERFDELAARRHEVERLNGVVESALSILRNAGLEGEAENLQRKLGYRPQDRTRPSHR